MATVSSEQITALLVRWGEGDDHALDRLVPLIYNRLRRMAVYRLQNERQGHTLQPSDLVHEAFLKLRGSAKVQWQNRLHFYAVAARAMRQVLVDYARKYKRRIKTVPLDEVAGVVFAPERSVELLALDDALSRLAADEPRKALVAELRFFGGLDNKEIAELLDISANTVIRDWDYAKAWLTREIRRQLGLDERSTSQDG
jgi:RNA polymerase sigma-70 factor, ECF subfamily